MTFNAVKGHPRLAKEVSSGGVVNTDREALVLARKRKAAVMADKQRIDNLEDKLNKIEQLLMKLVEDKHGD
jgi:hypothetical protein